MNNPKNRTAPVKLLHRGLCLVKVRQTRIVFYCTSLFLHQKHNVCENVVEMFLNGASKYVIHLVLLT